MSAVDDLAHPSASPGVSFSVKTDVVPPYRVLLHNDDETPMDFVVDTLVRYFIPDAERAVEVMLEAHRRGKALVAVMPLEHAEFKVAKAHDRARANGYPLSFSIEPCGK